MLAKLTTLQIHLVGFFTSLIVLGLLFLLFVKPKQEQLQKVQAETKDIQTNQHGTQEDVTKHNADLKKAQNDQAKVKAEWQLASAEYMPNIVWGTDVLQTYQNVIVNLPRQWGTFITSWYDVQRNQGIARVPGTEFPIASFPTDPNAAVASVRTITFPQGAPWNVTVEAKSFDALMAHLRRFNREMKHHGMPVIDNVSLSGQSPNLIGRYTLALYVIPPTPPPGADPRLGGGAAAGAGAGAGGFGGGRMGMPGYRGGPGMGPMMGRGAMGPMGPGGPMPGAGAPPPAASSPDPGDK
jgi:hypothetical protein